MVEAVDAETPSIISLFAGRIADTGVDPIPFVTESVKKAAAKPNCEVLWASTRELINIYQAEACGCQIITVPNSILAKRKNIGRDPYEVSLDTVRGFAKDIAALWASIFCRNANTGCAAGCSPRPFLSLSLTRFARVALGKGKAGAADTNLPVGWRLASIFCRGQRYPRLRRAKLRVFSKVKALYQLAEARNSPRFGSDDAKTGAVFDYIASEGGWRAQTWCKSVLRSVAASPDVTPS